MTDTESEEIGKNSAGGAINTFKLHDCQNEG